MNVLKTARALGFVGVLMAFAACADKPLPAKAEPLGYSHLSMIRLDVAELQIIPAYASPKRRPQVEHLFRTPPQKAVEDWARDRIRAVGRANRAMIVVRRASVIEVPLKTKKGLSGAFTKEPSERYEAELEVELEIRDDTGKRIGWMTTTTRRERSVQEGMTEPQRLAFWQRLTAELIDDMAKSFDLRVSQHLGKFRK
jgi:hypothetical protein